MIFFALLGIILSFGNDADKVLSQNERDPFTVDAKLFLAMIKKVTEVDVKDLTNTMIKDNRVVCIYPNYVCFLHHNIFASVTPVICLIYSHNKTKLLQYHHECSHYS